MSAANLCADMKGRRVLVTGGARGLGAAFASALIQTGARVVITDILDDAGRALAQQLGPDAHYLSMDMAKPEAVRQGVDQAAEWLGGLDGLVNNAAITNSGGKDMQDIAIETWDQVMAVNVRGPWLATVAAHPHLATSTTGRVVNIASDTALWGAPRLMAYVASKGAVMAMTHAMAREMGADGITVNAIAPGLTLVEATEYIPQDRHDLYRNGRALQRAQQPEDVCGAVVFFLSDASAFVSGQLLPVNGGFVMH